LEVLDPTDGGEDEADEGCGEDGELLGEGTLAPLHRTVQVIEHVLEGILGEPEVEKDGDKHVAEGWVEEGHDEWDCCRQLENELPRHDLLAEVPLVEKNEK
jgi:hypothetical protein